MNTFEKAIEVTPLDSQTYSAHLDQKWCIGAVPHGGYIASILYRTTTTHFQITHASRFATPPEPISLQLSYLRRTSTGPAVLKVQNVKIGSRVSTIHVTLLQAGGADKENGKEKQKELEVKAVAYINASPPESESGPSYEGVWGLQPEPEPAAGPGSGAVDLAALAQNQQDGNWARLKLPHPAMFALNNTEMYGPVSSSSSSSLETKAERVVDQWARFAPGGRVARWSNEAVVFLLDVFPAALERLGALEALRVRDEKAVSVGSEGDLAGPFWYPTVSMNIDLKTRMPPQGVEWLYSRVETKMLRNSRADLEVTLLDANGGLVATSSQIALVVDASRNTQGRQREQRKQKGSL